MARPWLKVEGALLEHPKTRALARLWNCHPYTVTGFLIRLWAWCLEYQLDGNVDGRPADVLDELAAPCLERAPSERATVREALERVGFVDPNGRIHDWNEYAGAIVQHRRKDRTRKRLERLASRGTRRKNVPTPSTGRAKDGRRMSAPRVEKSRVDRNVSLDTQFIEAWNQYPKRTGTNSKAAAHRQWQARLADGVSAQSLLDGTERYARFCRATGKLDTEYVMQGQRFYGRDRYWEGDFAANGNGNGNGHAPVDPKPATTKAVADLSAGRSRIVVVPLDDPRPAL